MQHLNGGVFDIGGYVSISEFIVNCLIELGVSVKNLNIRGKEVKWTSRLSLDCQISGGQRRYSICQALFYTALRPGH